MFIPNIVTESKYLEPNPVGVHTDANLSTDSGRLSVKFKNEIESSLPTVVISEFHGWELYLLNCVYSDFVNEDQN